MNYTPNSPPAQAHAGRKFLGRKTTQIRLPPQRLPFQGRCQRSWLREFEHNKFTSTLISATDPLRHFLRKCHLPLPRGARQGEAFASLKAFRQTRIRPYKLLDLYILHTMCQNDVDQLISGAVAFCGKPVKLCQRILANSDCNDPVSVLAALFDNQGIVLHCMVPLNL